MYLQIERHAVALALVGVITVSLAACGKKEEKKIATQVAAKVGSEEISVHQINQALSRNNVAAATPEAVRTMSREVLEKLIDQQIAMEQAKEGNLDRSPDVVSQIEAARREILARAYVQQLASALPKPSPEEIKKYFADHPELFAERRVFNLQEILIPAAATAAVSDQVRSILESGKSLEDVAILLRSKNVKFGGGAATRTAEQIPLELLPKLHALKDGQATMFGSPQGMTVLRVVSSQSVPVSESMALPRIEQFLSNQRGAVAVSKSIKDLRAKVGVTYMGEFAQVAGPRIRRKLH